MSSHRAHPSDRKPFRILALSAGGYQGLFTAMVLEAIEEQGPGLLRDRFDLISGTSIGGIIALGIAAGVPCGRIVDAFLEEGARIFPYPGPGQRRLSAARDALRFLLRPKYDGRDLRGLVEDLPGMKGRLGDLPVEVLIPATRVRDGEPVCFTRGSAPGIALADAAMATSAAPMMFPTVRIGAEDYADGAIHATAPDALALHEAEHRLGVDPSRIEMLSVGTMSARFNLARPVKQSLGVLSWVQRQRLVKTVLAAQERSTILCCSDRLGPRYTRIDATLDERDLDRVGLDVATPEARAVMARAALNALEKHDLSSRRLATSIRIEAREENPFPE